MQVFGLLCTKFHYFKLHFGNPEMVMWVTSKVARVFEFESLELQEVDPQQKERLKKERRKKKFINNNNNNNNIIIE
jgi:hypothetical protein